MDKHIQKRFQILALSGGGYRGLYTARILADIEDEIGGPIARHFDLLAGTSIGGILALALALEIPAQQMVKLFEENGGAIFKKRFSLKGLLRSPYTQDHLKALLSDDALFGNKLLGACRHPVIVPTISYSTGEPVLFKTAHHSAFHRDHRHKLIDVGLATSAAPSYFPRHIFNNNQYIDGGMFANAPGLLGLHEAEHFFGRKIEEVYMLAIGTMSTKFTVDPRRNRSGGTLDWGGINPATTPKKLFGISISVQESLSTYILDHRLTKDRHFHIDDELTDERAKAVALDKADKNAQEVLLGAASERSKRCIADARFRDFFEYKAPTPTFYHGENASPKGESC